MEREIRDGIYRDVQEAATEFARRVGVLRGLMLLASRPGGNSNGPLAKGRLADASEAVLAAKRRLTIDLAQQSVFDKDGADTQLRASLALESLGYVPAAEACTDLATEAA